MPKEISDNIVQIIKDALQKGMSRSHIASVVGVSKRAVTRIHTNLKRYGTTKSPKTGLKIGRPIKITNQQAVAMLSWIKQRDYQFYVKDLVGFLRRKHGFEGCDVTVRRALARAGYKKKLPAHQSKTTTWIPPEDAQTQHGSFLASLDETISQETSDIQADSAFDADAEETDADGQSWSLAKPSSSAVTPFQGDNHEDAGCLVPWPSTPISTSGNTFQDCDNLLASSPLSLACTSSQSNTPGSTQPFSATLPALAYRNALTPPATPTPSAGSRQRLVAKQHFNLSYGVNTLSDPNMDLVFQVQALQSQVQQQNELIIQLQQQLAQQAFQHYDPFTLPENQFIPHSQQQGWYN